MTLRNAWLLLSLCACGGPAGEVREIVTEVKHEIAGVKNDVAVDLERSKAWDDYEAKDYASFVKRMETVSTSSQLDIDLYNLACGYALAGDKEKALATLAVVAERGQDYGMRDDDDLASLRTDPRFAGIVEKAETHEKASEFLEPYRDMAMEYYARGEHEAFVTIMEKIARWSANETDLYNLACGYALTGRHDEAIATLTALADRGAHGQAAHDSDFDSLRSDPRFQAIIARPAVH